MQHKNSHEPLIRLSKRTDISLFKAILVRAVAIVAALILCAVIVMLITGGKTGFFQVYTEMFRGTFGSTRRITMLLRDISALLCIGLALAPAFRMRFWNIGAEGQTIIGALASVAVIKLMPSLPLPAMLAVMFLTSVIAGALWGIIPAFFKAKFNTNETLFTLMMNYVAMQLVSSCVILWERQPGSNDVGILQGGNFPKVFGVDYGINLIVVAILTVIAYIYLKYSKQGYEIAVVGESVSTAKYIGINVKTVIIRTMAISGAVCGLAGFLLIAGTHHTINTGIVDGDGFTAIIVAWLAKLNPVFMLMTSFLIVFLNRGTAQIASSCGLNSYASDIIIGVMLFFIIGCEFFINYKVSFRGSHKKEVE